MIRAFARVVAVEPRALLYIVGQGDHPEDRTYLENEAARLNISSSVVFVGQLPQQQALAYVQESDYVRVAQRLPQRPSFESPQPDQLVEYMAAGKPVVANDHPEQKRVIEESGAGICVAYDEDAFAAAILSLLKARSRTVQGHG